VSSTPACRFLGSTWPGPPGAAPVARCFTARHSRQGPPVTPRSPAASPACPCPTPGRVYRWSLSRSPATSSPSPRAHAPLTPVVHRSPAASPACLPDSPPAHARPGRAGPAISHFEDKYEAYIRWKLFENFVSDSLYTVYTVSDCSHLFALLLWLNFYHLGLNLYFT
jgi:hypothetical protein